MGLAKYALLPLGPPGWVIFYLCRRAEKNREARLLEIWRTASSRPASLRGPIEWFTPTGQPTDNIHGRQEWASEEQLARAGRLRKHGTFVGLTYENRRAIYTGEDSYHRILLGGTGFGKSTAGFSAAALDDSLRRTSIFAPDIAGEMACVTGDFRRRCGKVYQINPLGLFSKRLRALTPAFYNPVLDWLNPASRYFWARAAKLSALCVSKGTARDPYWGLTSREGTQFGLMAVRKYLPARMANLPSVARIVCDDLPRFAQYILRRCNDPNIAAMAARWANPRAAAGEIKSFTEVIENMRSELAFLLDPGIAEVLSGPTNFSFVQHKRQVTTSYCLLPGEVLDGPLVRFFKLMTGCCLAETMRMDQGRVHLQMMLDELYLLELSDLPKLYATARKFNVGIWGAAQDVAQLKELYPQTFETVINNAQCVQFMSAFDNASSEMVSSLLGDTEVWGCTKNITKYGESYTQQRRRFMLPQEVRTLHPELQICWLSGVSAPVLCRKAPYYQTSAKWRAQGNPYYRG